MCGIGTVNSNDWEVAVLRHGVEGVAPLKPRRHAAAAAAEGDAASTMEEGGGGSK